MNPIDPRAAQLAQMLSGTAGAGSDGRFADAAGNSHQVMMPGNYLGVLDPSTIQAEKLISPALPRPALPIQPPADGLLDLIRRALSRSPEQPDPRFADITEKPDVGNPNKSAWPSGSFVR